MVLPSHTRDQLQPLDTSVFEPVKHYSSLALKEFLKRLMHLPGGLERAGGPEVWDCVREGFGQGVCETNLISSFCKTGLSL